MTNTKKKEKTNKRTFQESLLCFNAFSNLTLFIYSSKKQVDTKWRSRSQIFSELSANPRRCSRSWKLLSSAKLLQVQILLYKLQEISAITRIKLETVDELRFVELENLVHIRELSQNGSGMCGVLKVKKTVLSGRTTNRPPEKLIKDTNLIKNMFIETITFAKLFDDSNQTKTKKKREKREKNH